MKNINLNKTAINAIDWSLNFYISITHKLNTQGIEANLHLHPQTSIHTKLSEIDPDDAIIKYPLNREILGHILVSNEDFLLEIITGKESSTFRVSPHDIVGPNFNLATARSMISNISHTPAMPKRCIDLYSDFLNNSTKVIEYGSGGSTLLAQNSKIKAITSVESDFNWIIALMHLFKNNLINSNTILESLYVDIGLTGAWGKPTTMNSVINYPSYAIAPWISVDNVNNPIDLVLIDGRFRVSCFASSLISAKPGTPIIFDDYNNRPQYHIIENIIKPTVRVDRQGVFLTPTNFDRSMAHQIAMAFSTDPA